MNFDEYYLNQNLIFLRKSIYFLNNILYLNINVRYKWVLLNKIKKYVNNKKGIVKYGDNMI